MHEFCEAAFRQGGRPHARFYDQLYHGIELYSDYLGTRCPAWTYNDIYGRRRKHLTDPFQLLGFLYTPGLLASLETELAQAEKAADTEKVRVRLALVRREFDYLKSLARVVHLYHAFQDAAGPWLARPPARRHRRPQRRDCRLLRRGRGQPSRSRLGLHDVPAGRPRRRHLRLAHDGYQEPFTNTP